MKPTEGALDFVSTKVSVLGEMAEAGEIVLSRPQVCPLGTHIFNEETHKDGAMRALGRREAVAMGCATFESEGDLCVITFEVSGGLREGGRPLEGAG